MKHHLRTEIDIQAPPETVWEILTDLSHYVDWNPFVVSAEGTVAAGERLTNIMQAPGGKAMTIRPTVTVVEPRRSFEWLGHFGLPGVFDGRHRFDLEATSTGTHLTHTEHFSGLLVRSMKRTLDNGTLAGFAALNTALKSRAEAKVGLQR